MSNPAQSSIKHRIGQWTGISTIALVGLVLIFFLIVPVSVIVGKAFINQGSFTLEYFPLLFENQLYTNSLWNSLWVGVATTILATVVALPLAIITTKYDFPFKGILSGLILVPMVMPPFVGAIGVQQFFSRLGSVNLFLMDLGMITQPIDWLGPDTMFWAVVILEVMHLYPIMYLNLSAALANIDPSVEEMATTLGVPRWRQYLDIIWPLARPGYFAGAIIVFIWAMTDLGVPLLVGFHETIPVQIFNMISDINANPVGYALVFIVIVMTVSFFLISKLFLGTNKYEMMAKGHVTSGQRPLRGMPLFLSLVFISLVVGVALIPHFAVLVTSLSERWFLTVMPEHWTFSHYLDIAQTELAVLGIQNSFFLAGLATFVDLILGLLIAYVIVRKLIPFTGLLDSLVMIPLALPGIVLAFGYVVTYTGSFLDPLDYPIPLLVIAYAIRRLPYMVRSAVAGLQQMNVSLEEASSTFGATKLHTLRKITIPLVTANLIAGGLLCFSYAMLDVSDSLILAMKEQYYPLTKAIYSLFLEHGRGTLLASSLGMVGMLILVSCIMGASLLLGKKMGELFRS